MKLSMKMIFMPEDGIVQIMLCDITFIVVPSCRSEVGFVVSCIHFWNILSCFLYTTGPRCKITCVVSLAI